MYGVETIPFINKWRAAPYYASKVSQITFGGFIMAFTVSKGYAKRKWEGYRKL